MAHVRATNVNHPVPTELLGEKAISRLMARHAALEDELADMTAGPMIDWDGVKLVKLRKLDVSQQLEVLKRQMQ